MSMTSQRKGESYHDKIQNEHTMNVVAYLVESKFIIHPI